MNIYLAYRKSRNIGYQSCVRIFRRMQSSLSFYSSVESISGGLFQRNLNRAFSFRAVAGSIFTALSALMCGDIISIVVLLTVCGNGLNFQVHAV